MSQLHLQSKSFPPLLIGRWQRELIVKYRHKVALQAMGVIGQSPVQVQSDQQSRLLHPLPHPLNPKELEQRRRTRSPT
jgi:hypothetical protein